MIIDLGTTVRVVTRPELSTETSSVQLSGTFDDPSGRVVVARLVGFPDLTLWSGADYDAIGDWTQDQADARIVELLTGS